MKRRLVQSFIFIMVMAAFACNRPRHLDMVAAEPGDSFVTSEVSLHDTLPKHVVQNLRLDHVTGLRFTYSDGHTVTYFDYTADKTAVLHAISNLPFNKFSRRADTACRAIPYSELMEIEKAAVNYTEAETAEFFWSAAQEEYDVYECIKEPSRHTLLLSRSSGRIIHRVTTNG